MLKPSPDRVHLIARDRWVRLKRKAGCFRFCQFQKSTVTQKIGDPKLRQTSLLGPEKLTGTALLQVEFGQLKAILSPNHRLKPSFSLLGHVAASHQNAVALGGATTD